MDTVKINIFKFPALMVLSSNRSGARGEWDEEIGKNKTQIYKPDNVTQSTQQGKR